MDETRALPALQALAQETRLAIFRLLVAAGPSGLPAGAIAERLEVPPSTLSFHLKELDRSGLVRSWRRSRQIFYAAEFETMRRLLSFLTEDCCGGHPEICGGLVQLVEQASSRAASCASKAKIGEGCRG
ncbi:MAG: metalloregulator ArsR/SmtB family transcription factor [Geminicoccaceae bacterium]|nr:metalloregulator ArsR/SmtB family transcription factor [Geminicoccaceae bacterium]